MDFKNKVDDAKGRRLKQGTGANYLWATEDTLSIQNLAVTVAQRDRDGWEFVQFVTQSDRFVMLFRQSVEVETEAE
jgi:hypothetical protein